MDTNPSEIPIERLLEDARWTRRLAGTLVRDGATAEDVVQETFRAALLDPPKADRPARPWLAAVTRNFARKRYRGEARRRAREAAVARPESGAVPTPDELASRLETERELAGLVAGLAEPYRATVLLRYWENLSSAEIARRTDVPAGTVRWRLKKALDDLRERLDEGHGGRRVWALLLLPIADRPSGPAAVATAAGSAAVLGGALAVKKLAAAIALFIVALVAARLAGVFDSGAPTAPRPPAVAETATPEAIGPGGDEAADASAATGAVPPPPVSPPEAKPEDAVVTARLVGPDGRPIEGATIDLRPDWRDLSGTATSGADGRAVLRVAIPEAEASLDLLVTAPGRVLLARTVAVRRGGATPLGDVVLPPGGVVSGRVLDTDGRPAEGAEVVLDEPEGPLEGRAADPLLGPGPSIHRTKTSGDGSFRLEGVPAGSWRVWAGAHARHWVTIPAVAVSPEREVSGLVLRLESLKPGEFLQGVVLDPDGKPVPFARVTCTLRTADGVRQRVTSSVGEAGRFFFLLRGPYTSLDVRAGDPAGKYSDAVREEYHPGADDLVLRLDAGHPIRLKVVDESGEPIAAFRWTLYLGPGNMSVGYGKGEAGQARIVPPSSPWRLEVSAPGHARATAGPFEAGRGPEEIPVTMPALAGISGRVLVAGAPVAGARVRVHALVPSNEVVRRNGYRTFLEPGCLAKAVTDAEGRFRLMPDTAARVRLRVEAEGYAPAESDDFDYDPTRPVTDLAIELVRGGTIEGKVVVLGDGDPEGTIVALSRADSYARTVRAGPGGAFRVEHLTPGPWLVEVTQREILPDRGETNSGIGGGGTVPFNCEVRSGATTKVELTVDHRDAELTGRLRIDGRPPSLWTAALFPPKGDSLVPAARTDVGEDGSFRLTAAPGSYRLVLTSPGGPHVATVIVERVDLAGPTPFSCDLTTVPFDAPPRAAGGPILYHRWAGPDGRLVLTPLPAKGGTIRVPPGSAALVRFDLAHWSDPLRWPVVRDLKVR